MKRGFLFAALILAAWRLLAGVSNAPTQVSLVWTYPTGAVSADTLFSFYSNNALGLPPTAWPLFTNVWATNYTDANLNATNLDGTGTNMVCKLPFLTLPGQGFYVGLASNFWGASDFSPVASTPPVPRSDVSLRLTRP